MYRLLLLTTLFLGLFSCKKDTVVTPDPDPVIVVPTIPIVSAIPDAPEPTTDKTFLDKVQKETFRYFWEYAHPASGMARERTSSQDIVTTGGTGMGIMATVVAVNRGWVSKSEALTRLNRIADFLTKAERFHGVFPHWYNGATGKVNPFSAKDNGGDLVETSFLVAGLLTAREYFSGSAAEETALRNKITTLWESVEWNWHVKDNKLYWHWSPTFNFEMNFPLKGYNETLIAHVLAMASPKYPITKSIYQNTWNVSKVPTDYYGYNLDMGERFGGPLFFSHYSFLGLDPKQMADANTYYWNQGQNHVMINRHYCVYKAAKENGYSEEIWGLTSSDEPNGYSDHSAIRDNGTVAPTAALASFPYSPYYSMQALKGFYKKKSTLYGTTGFYDAFNTKSNWVAKDCIAIDQGPIVVMIENYRSGLIWKLFMQVPEIQAALQGMGFAEPKHEVGFPFIVKDVETQFADLMVHTETNNYEVDFMADAGSVELDLLKADGSIEKSIISGKTAMNKVEKASFTANAGTYSLRLKVGSKTVLLPVKLR